MSLENKCFGILVILFLNFSKNIASYLSIFVIISIKILRNKNNLENLTILNIIKKDTYFFVIFYEPSYFILLLYIWIINLI